jgi:hypothetical protein
LKLLFVLYFVSAAVRTLRENLQAEGVLVHANEVRVAKSSET